MGCLPSLCQGSLLLVPFHGRLLPEETLRNRHQMERLPPLMKNYCTYYGLKKTTVLKVRKAWNPIPHFHPVIHRSGSYSLVLCLDFLLTDQFPCLG